MRGTWQKPKPYEPSETDLKVGDWVYKIRVNPDGTVETRPCYVTGLNYYVKGKFYYIEEFPNRTASNVGDKRSFEKVVCSKHGRSLISRTPDIEKVLEKLREDALQRIEERKKLLERERKWLELIDTAYRRQMEGISSDSDDGVVKLVPVCLGEELNGTE